MENEEEKLNQLKIENEIKKMKLSLEYGANFFSPTTNKLPAEIEGQWLDNIQKFEDSYAHNKIILLYDFIGRPNYRNIEDVPKPEIELELTKMLDLLRKKGICVDTICKVADSELYRFICEELFQQEINDIGIDGMLTHFTYEEFHPNHAYDIEQHCKQVLDAILNKKKKLDFTYLPVSDEIDSSSGTIKKEEAKNRIEIFRQTFSKLELQYFLITSILINEDKSEAETGFDINYSGTIKGGSEEVIFSGSGSFKLKKEYDYWCIHKINIPGVPL